jgi:hypothetical protein
VIRAGSGALSPFSAFTYIRDKRKKTGSSVGEEMKICAKREYGVGICLFALKG